MDGLTAVIALQKLSAQTGKIPTHELDHLRNRLDGAFQERNLAVRRVIMPRQPAKASKTRVFYAFTDRSPIRNCIRQSRQFRPLFPKLTRHFRKRLLHFLVLKRAQVRHRKAGDRIKRAATDRH